MCSGLVPFIFYADAVYVKICREKTNTKVNRFLLSIIHFPQFAFLIFDSNFYADFLLKINNVKLFICTEQLIYISILCNTQTK